MEFVKRSCLSKWSICVKYDAKIVLKFNFFLIPLKPGNIGILGKPNIIWLNSYYLADKIFGIQLKFNIKYYWLKFKIF